MIFYKDPIIRYVGDTEECEKHIQDARVFLANTLAVAGLGAKKDTFLNQMSLSDGTHIMVRKTFGRPIITITASGSKKKKLVESSVFGKQLVYAHSIYCLGAIGDTDRGSFRFEALASVYDCESNKVAKISNPYFGLKSADTGELLFKDAPKLLTLPARVIIYDHDHFIPTLLTIADRDQTPLGQSCSNPCPQWPKMVDPCTNTSYLQGYIISVSIAPSTYGYPPNEAQGTIGEKLEIPAVLRFDFSTKKYIEGGTGGEVEVSAINNNGIITGLRITKNGTGYVTTNENYRFRRTVDSSQPPASTQIELSNGMKVKIVVAPADESLHFHSWYIANCRDGNIKANYALPYQMSNAFTDFDSFTVDPEGALAWNASTQEAIVEYTDRSIVLNSKGEEKNIVTHFGELLSDKFHESSSFLSCGWYGWRKIVDGWPAAGQWFSDSGSPAAKKYDSSGTFITTDERNCAFPSLLCEWHYVHPIPGHLATPKITDANLIITARGKQEATQINLDTFSCIQLGEFSRNYISNLWTEGAKDRVQASLVINFENQSVQTPLGSTASIDSSGAIIIHSDFTYYYKDTVVGGVIIGGQECEIDHVTGNTTRLSPLGYWRPLASDAETTGLRPYYWNAAFPSDGDSFQPFFNDSAILQNRWRVALNSRYSDADDIPSSMYAMQLYVYVIARDTEPRFGPFFGGIGIEGLTVMASLCPTTYNAKGEWRTSNDKLYNPNAAERNTAFEQFITGLLVGAEVIAPGGAVSVNTSFISNNTKGVPDYEGTTFIQNFLVDHA